MSIKVFGHKSPDTDSVISAIAAAYLLDGEPFVQGDLNRETRFVLEKFALAAPKRLESVAGESIALVDTSDPLHLPADIGDADIKYVFDHHNLGGIKTKGPFEGWFMPVGSTAAILFDYAKSKGVAIPADIAGAMAMAVISDTVLFKSPTTTGHDRRAVEELSEIAGIDYEKLGMEMLVVKSSIEGETADSLINRDYKEFDINGKKFGIGQIELVDSSIADSRIPEIKSRLNEILVQKGYDDIVFAITDIMKEGSKVFVYGADADEIARIIGGALSDGGAWIDGLMSRKKQIVAPLNEKLSGVK